MKQNKKILVAAAAALLLAGCDTMDKSGSKEFFPAEEGRSINNFCAAQASCGAKADATLERMHFTGNKLNSLGEAKLDLMLCDEATDETLTIYMDFANDDTDLRARRDAVTNYLEDRGMDKDHLELKLGTNPDQTMLAAEGIANLAKLQGGGSDDSAKASGTSGGSSGSSSESK